MFKTYSWLLFALLPLSGFKQNQELLKHIPHEVTIVHPGEKDPVEAILVEIQNKQGLPIAYTMNVNSVICLEKVCKEIPVKLFWNNIGEYQKYEIAEGKTLEKYEADLFENQDYVKLHKILSDKESPFKEVFYNEILTIPDQHGNNEVDAVSGATAIDLDEADTVPGAALTCYTLWHWANGEVVSKIRTQTSKSASVKQLQQFILMDNNIYGKIALKELQQRNEFSQETIDFIIIKALKDKGMLTPAFNYLKNVSPKFYFSAMNRLFFEGGKEQKLAVVQSLKECPYSIPVSYLESFSSELAVLSFQEVSLFLSLIEDKNENSKVVINNTLKLLNADFLIARRAYWFLEKQELNIEQSKKLHQFYEKHKNRL